MTLFLCLSVPNKASEIRSAFNQQVYLTDVTNTPIGHATIGNKAQGTAYLLQVNVGSASLLGKGSRKKTSRDADHSDFFITGIKRLIEDEKVEMVSFLVHWMHGYITAEQVIVKEKCTIAVETLGTLLPNVEQDVRYIVLPHAPNPF